MKFVGMLLAAAALTVAWALPPPAQQDMSVIPQPAAFNAAVSQDTDAYIASDRYYQQTPIHENQVSTIIFVAQERMVATVEASSVTIACAYDYSPETMKGGGCFGTELAG